MAPLRLERVYDGPVEDLWELWTTKEGFTEWFTPPGCRVEVPVLELRVGGAFDHVMTVVGEEQLAYLRRIGQPPSMHARGRIVALVPNRLLHIRFSVDFVPGVEPYPYDIIVELKVEGARVRMIVTADQHPDPERTRIASETLTSQLEQFDALLASKRREPRRD